MKYGLDYGRIAGLCYIWNQIQSMSFCKYANQTQKKNRSFKDSHFTTRTHGRRQSNWASWEIYAFEVSSGSERQKCDEGSRGPDLVRRSISSNKSIGETQRGAKSWHETSHCCLFCLTETQQASFSGFLSVTHRPNLLVAKSKEEPKNGSQRVGDELEPRDVKLSPAQFIQVTWIHKSLQA